MPELVCAEALLADDTPCDCALHPTAASIAAAKSSDAANTDSFLTKGVLMALPPFSRSRPAIIRVTMLEPKQIDAFVSSKRQLFPPEHAESYALYIIILGYCTRGERTVERTVQIRSVSFCQVILPSSRWVGSFSPARVSGPQWSSSWQ